MLKNKTTYALLLLLLFTACAPYSLPEKKVRQKEFAFDYYRQSQQNMLDGNYQPALEYIDKAISINPNFANFYMLRGDILLNLDKPDEALKAFQRATDKRSNFTKAYLRMAHIFSSMGRHDQALQQFRKALVSDETKTAIYFDITREALAMGEIGLALDQLELYKIAGKGFDQPLSYEYYQLRGRCFVEQQKFQQAISELQKGFRLNPQDQDILTLLARSYFAEKQFESGFMFANKLLARDNQSALAYYLRGVYYFQNGKWDDARTQAELALRYSDKIPEAKLLLGKVLMKSGEAQKALKLLNEFKAATENEDAKKEAEQLIHQANEEING